MSTHKVVFTDIDGTLIDINTEEYGKKTCSNNCAATR
jgi:predicted mannosyl-3-phosphoglycerate phosphatase (HAD superfamily)